MAPQKKCTGLTLPMKCERNSMHDAVGRHELAPEQVHGVGIIGGVRVVVGERDRRDRPRWACPNLHRDAELVERTHRLGIEVGDRLGFERDPTGAAVTGSDVQPVLDEVELDVEDTRSVRHRGRGQTSRADVEGDLPPVVDHRRVRESDLADDLGPHVQRVSGGGPLVDPQRRPVQG